MRVNTLRSVAILLLLSGAAAPGPALADGERRRVSGRSAVDNERTYWRREGTGWRRITRERSGPQRHEWSPTRPDESPAAGQPLAPSGLFRPYVAFGVGSWPEAVALGDLNGDGRRDVALVTSFYFDPANDHKVFVFLQTATGALAAPVRYDLPTAQQEESIDVGDVTGDGRADVVVGADTDILVLAQNAAGALDPAVAYPSTDSNQVKIGDFDHDGRGDVAGLDWGTSTVAVWLQTPAGTLAAPVSYPAQHGGWDELEAGDVNGDGRDDLVVMSGQLYAIPALSVLVQSPGGGFLPAASYGLGFNDLTRGAEVADVNGDGRNDVVATYGGNSPSAHLAAFLQNATGTLNPQFSLTSYDIPEPVESADLDGNGRRDLAVLHGGWVAMGVYLQGGSGTLGLEALEPVPYASHYTPQGIALGDVNGDGRADGVIADYNHGLVVVYQKSAYDVGAVGDGPSSAATGSTVAYSVQVTNHGTAPATGLALAGTLSAGLQFVGSTPAGACAAAGATVSCALPAVAPGQQTSVVIQAQGVAPGPQTLAITAATAQPDGYPGDNTATMTTQFLGTCQERLLDGGFELGTGSPYWQQASTNFGTPLCTFGNCGDGGGTAGPRSGSWWSWFGGIDVFEQAAVSQVFTRPTAGTARLRFHLWIGVRSGNGTDAVRALVDGQPVFSVTEATPGYAGYTPVDVDISAFAAPGNHTVRFESTTFGPGVTNFNVDDASIEWCPLPTLTVSDPAPVTEGNAGSAPATFGVSLSQPSSQPVTVSYTTAPPPSGVSATAGEDYTPAAGTITFVPGAASTVVTVNVLGDALDEHDESLALVLFAPVGATLADPEGVATITDDDPLPVVALGDAAVGESGLAALPVSLTPVSGRAVTVAFTTANGTATAGADYSATTGTVTFPPGAAQRTALVPILADSVDELDETFTATLAAPDFATLGDAQGQVTIDDDDGPSVRVGDRSVTEPTGTAATATFDVTLSASSVQPVTLSYATVDGTATAGSDYAPSSGVVTFPPGSTAATVEVSVQGDALDEPNETFQVVLSDVADATPADAAGTGFILDDDGGIIEIAGELAHGAVRSSDLASTPAPARHLYLLARPAASSWEVMVDAASGDVGAGQGPSLARLAPDLSTVLQGSVPVGTGSARRLAVVNALTIPVTDYVEVRSAGCSTTCGADDVYRVTARETTLAAPRFNNSGGQGTVLVLQERAGTGVQGTVWFWSAGGLLLGSHPFALDPRQSLVLNTTTVAGVAGQGGAVTVTHDGPYGGLAGKAVALDPAAGFSFDTPLEARRR